MSFRPPGSAVGGKRRLANQPDAAKAMAHAMRQAIADDEPPAAWAAFTVIGAPEPAVPQAGS